MAVIVNKIAVIIVRQDSPLLLIERIRYIVIIIFITFIIYIYEFRKTYSNMVNI